MRDPDEHYDPDIQAMVYINYLPNDLHVGFHDGVNVEKIVMPDETRYIVTKLGEGNEAC